MSLPTLPTRFLSTTPSRLSQVDARVKLLVALAWLLLLALVPPGQLAPLLRLGSLALIVALVAKVSVEQLSLRLVPLAPFLLVALFIPFLHPGESVLALGPLSLTAQGLERGTEVLVRMLSLGLVVALLAATTPFAELLRAMRTLRVPATLVLTLELLFRFLFLLLDEASRMARAYRARGGEWQPASLARQSLGSLVAVLFLRAHDRGERVHHAMVARGYGTELEAAPNRPWSTPTLIGAAAFVLLLVGLRWSEALLALMRSPG